MKFTNFSLVKPLAVLVVLILAGTERAITNGMPDDGAHPYVGQLLFYVPEEDGWFGCSGTLISPTVVVTAGHCVTGVGLNGAATPNCTAYPGNSCGNDMWVNFSEVPHVSGLNNAPRYIDVVNYFNSHPEWVHGTVYVHPEYASAFQDLGVVILDEAQSPPFGQLPALGYLDQFLAAHHDEQRFTPVGYGLEFIRPVRFGGRQKASVMLVSLNGLGLPYGSFAMFSNDPGRAHQGGVCFGDSGGPVLDEANTSAPRTIVSVSSFVFNQNCTGINGSYRIDQADDLAFIGQFP